MCGNSQEVPVNVTRFQHTAWFTEQHSWKSYKLETSYVQNKSKYLAVVQINIHLCTLTIHECTTSNTHSQHGTLRPRLSVRRNRMLQPVLNLLLTTQTARTTKLIVLQYKFQTPWGAGQERGRGVNWLTWHKAKISSLVSFAREFETKTGHGLIANCRET